MKSISIPLGIFFCVSHLFSCTGSNTSTSLSNQTVSPAQVKSIFINGDSIHYIEMGKGDPIVLVHGSLGDYRTWGKQMDTFSGKYHVIAYSRRYAYPNNKMVDTSSDFSVTPHTKDLVALLQALHLGPVHLIGHSYGAYTALLAAMEYPELVKTLTLGEPPVMDLLLNVPGGDTMLKNFIAQTLLPAREAFKADDSLKAVKTFINGVMGDSLYFDRISSADKELIMSNVLETRGTALTNKPFPPVTCEDLRKLTVPVLLVAGEKSPAVLLTATDELMRCLPNREKALLKNTSHGLEYENPSAFNEVVLGFLDKH